MRKGLAIGLCLLFVAAGASLYVLYRGVTGYVDYRAAEVELPAALAAYRADALPFVAKDVAPPRLASGVNAASAIRAAMRAMPPRETDAKLRKAAREPDAGSDALLAAYAKPLALVDAVRNRPSVDFARDWDLGTALLFPEYATIRMLARAATVRAERAAARGDDVAALRDLDLARRLAFWSGQEPGLIPMLVRITTESISLEGAERCLVRVAASPSRIARYAAWLREAPPLPRFRDALRGEAFLGVTTIRNLAPFGGFKTVLDTQGDSLGQNVDPKRLRRKGLPADTVARAFLARHLQTWHMAYAATDGFREDPERMGRRLSALEARLNGRKSLSYVLERILFPRFEPAGAAIVQLEARRAVRTGFAEALDLRARTGRWPETLGTKDPFTGGSLHLRRGKDFRVYSLGKDRKDDGGRLRREMPKGQDATFDEVAVFPFTSRFQTVDSRSTVREATSSPS